MLPYARSPCVPKITFGEGNPTVRKVTRSPAETERFAEEMAKKINGGAVIAFFGGLGMGKTAFSRGFVKGRGVDAEVSSPTFSLVNEYGGQPPIYHFDMYRVDSWDDLYTTGFFEYIDMGAILLVEWSENIENALPEDSIRVEIERGEGDDERIITVTGGGFDEDFGD